MRIQQLPSLPLETFSGLVEQKQQGPTERSGRHTKTTSHGLCNSGRATKVSERDRPGTLHAARTRAKVMLQSLESAWNWLARLPLLVRAKRPGASSNLLEILLSWLLSS
eukprot:scaffold2065_cov359-Prasinococcus_capsulatus_cf.AAC.6